MFFSFRVLILSVLISFINVCASFAEEKTIVIEISGLPIEVILNTETQTAAISSERLWFDNRDNYSNLDLKIPSFFENAGVMYELTEIQSGAFRSCKGINSLVIPSSVKIIGESAFNTCSSMESIEINASITSIPKSCFSGCSELKELNIPLGVEEICENALLNCKSLVKLTIPSSVSRVTGKSIWGGLDKIEEIYCNIEDPSFLPTNLFYTKPQDKYAEVQFHVKQSVKVYVPGESLDKYVNYFDWKSDMTSPFVALVSEPPIPTEIQLSKNELEMKIGETEQLVATVLPETVEHEPVTWESSDETVVTVANDGTVTALALGEATITVKSGELTATCKVNVVKVPVHDIQLPGINDLGVYFIGRSYQLTAVVSPDNATDKDVKWDTDNHSLATITEDGILTCHSEGKVNVIAIAGGVTRKAEIQIKPVELTSITLSPEILKMVVGEECELNIVISPTDATYQDIEWRIDNVELVSVENNKVKAIAAGETNVWAYIGQKHSNPCKVQIRLPEVSSLTLSTQSLTLTKGETAQLSVTIEPEIVSDAKIEWSSSNDDIATVDENGLITAVTAGDVIITAKSGNVTATCNVTVEPLKPESLTFELTSVALLEGETRQLHVTVLPEEGDFDIEWSVLDPQIATITSGGLLTAISTGETTIIAKCGDLKAECKVIVTKKVIAVEEVSLSASTLTLTEGEEGVLTVTILPADATDPKIEWSTSDATIATVEDGKVKAIAEGTVMIIASVGDKKVECSVTVTKKVIAVEEVSLSASTMTLTEGEEGVLTVTILPANATDVKVEWTTSDETIATVEDGKIKALSPGNATIIASVGEKKAECRVIVEPLKPESLTLELTSVALLTGETKQLKATVLPLKGEFNVEWSIADTKIATITSDGMLTALSVGETVVTAKCGDLVAECKVYVSKTIIAVDDVKLSASSITLTEGEETVLTVTILPEDATDPIVVWSTSDQTVATVVDGTVKALKEGTATITCSVGDKKAKCFLTVKSSVIPVESITLDISALVLKCGDTRQLKAEVKPDNATDNTVTWSSSNTEVATVDNDGIVTAIKPGTTNITAMAGEKTAVCRLIVNPIEVAEIELSESSIELNPREIITLNVTIKPDNATDKTVVWSSDNNDVATVSDGIITAISVGEALITARSGSQTAVCIVNVIPGVIELESIQLSDAEMTLEIGEHKWLSFVATPIDAEYTTVEWKSSNDKIATISNEGLVTGVSKGEAYIWLTVDNKAAACKVSVVEPIKTSISDVESDKGPAIRTMPGSIVITNLDPKDSVGVYSISGITVRPQTQVRTTDLTIKINTAGIYIVRINKQAMKIVVR